MSNRENSVLFSPIKLGDITLKNRIVMAPMTRSRAGDGDAPREMNATYYAQRASAGLIVTEGVQPSANGKGYIRTPGIYTDEQINGWRDVATQVEQKGGSLVMQIMHCGRIGSKHNKDTGSETLAPSVGQAKGEMYTDSHGMVEFDMPREMNQNDIDAVIEEYRVATKNAIDCGCEGVELHATSGYLPVQFLSSSSNQRTDGYGGSINNRIRFMLEVLEAMASVAGPGRVGIRISPGNPFNDVHDDSPYETYAALLEAISAMNLAYLHVIRIKGGVVDNIQLAKDHYKGNLIVNDSYDFDEAESVIASGEAQAVSFGRGFISNPDFVERLRDNSELAPMNNSNLYTQGEEGYIDYKPLK